MNNENNNQVEQNTMKNEGVEGDWTSAKIHALSELRKSNLYPLDNFSDQTIYAGSFLPCIKKVDHPIQRKKCIEKNKKTYRELSKFILELDNFISEELENIDYDYKFRCSCLAILNDQKLLFEKWFAMYGAEIPEQKTEPAGHPEPINHKKYLAVKEIKKVLDSLSDTDRSKRSVAENISKKIKKCKLKATTISKYLGKEYIYNGDTISLKL